nr:immunoglobulin heavy chain junction region [Mus musculus]
CASPSHYYGSSLYAMDYW